MHLALAFALALSPLTTATQDPAAEIPFRELGAFSKDLIGFAVHPDGKRVFALEADGRLHGWDLAREAPLWTVPSVPAVGRPTIDIGDDHVALGLGPSATVHSAESGEKVGATGVAEQLTAMSTACDPKDRWVWLGTREGVMVRLDPTDVNAWSTRAMDNGGVTAIAMDAGGKLLAVAGKDKTIRFVNAKSASVDEKRVIEGLEGPATALALDASAKQLASASEGGDVRIWKVAGCKQRALLEGHPAKLLHLAIDPKGRWVAGGHEDGVVVVWDLKKGERLAVMMRPDSGPVRGIAFLGKRAELMSCATGTRLTIWDLSRL